MIKPFFAAVGVAASLLVWLYSAVAGATEIEDHEKFLLLQPDRQESALTGLLVLVPGAQVEPEDYAQLAQTIQSRSSLSLWVAILRMTGNMPNPPQGAGRLRDAWVAVEERVERSLAAERVFVAGHSMGGIIARRIARDAQVGGLILLASYLPKSRVTGYDRLAEYPLPVLTLGGDLDGQTRLPWMVREFGDFRDLLAETRGKALTKKPVVILSEVNHYHFSVGQNNPADIPSPRPLTDSQAEIALVVNAFVENNVAWADLPEAHMIAAQTALREAVASTEGIATPILQANERDASLCESAQRMQVHPDFRDSVDIQMTNHSGVPGMVAAKPSVDVVSNRVLINAHEHIASRNNLLDISNTEYAPHSIWCKMKNTEAVGEVLGVAADALTCQSLNERAIAVAESLLSPEQALRYAERGHPLVAAADAEKGSGIAWVGAEVVFAATAEGAVFQSPALRTNLSAPARYAGMHYCKLLPVSRALEWMVVGALRP